MSSGISPLTSSCVSLPVSGSRSSAIFCIASFQIHRSSIEKRMVSMLSSTHLLSRSQTSAGVIVPISDTARSRNTPFWSFCACSPSWLASSSLMASGLPIENGLKRWLSLLPLATMKFRTRRSSSRPKRRASAMTWLNSVRLALPSTSTKPEPCARALTSRLRMAVIATACGHRQSQWQLHAPGQHPGRIESRQRYGEVEHRRLGIGGCRRHRQHEPGCLAAQGFRQPRRERTDVAQALRADALVLVLRTGDTAGDGHVYRSNPNGLLPDGGFAGGGTTTGGC